jgi:hypothetical protein
MQKNLELQRKYKNPPQRYPSVPFDGPFFKLEEINGNDNYSVPGTSKAPPYPSGWTPRQSSSSTSIIGQSPYNNNNNNVENEEEFNENGRIIYWPSPNLKNLLPKQIPPPPKNLRDPEHLEEFLRQEQMQKEAEAIRMKKEAELRNKQVKIKIENLKNNNNYYYFLKVTCIKTSTK